MVRVQPLCPVRQGYALPVRTAAQLLVKARGRPDSSPRLLNLQEYVTEAKQQQAEAAEKLAMVDAKIAQVKQLAAQQ